MASNPTAAVSGIRIIVCAITASVLLGVGLGLASASTGGSAAERSGLLSGLNPEALTFGVLLGPCVGGLIGLLWDRRGLAGTVGFSLIALGGGVVGLIVAEFAGAKTLAVQSGSAMSLRYGAEPSILVMGALLGVAVGVIVASWFSENTSPAAVRDFIPA